YSLQLIDMYTFNFAYIGSRETGNEAGNYLLAGPGWKGETPDGIDGVINCETEFAFVLYRTQLFDPADIENVKAIQADFKVQTLSQFLGEPAPPPAPEVDFIKPLTPVEQESSLEFFKILNFVLQFCPTNPVETDLMERFAKIDVGAGIPFNPESLSPVMRVAI